MRDRIMGDVVNLVRRGEKNVRVVQRRAYIPFDSVRVSNQIVDVVVRPTLSEEYYVEGANMTLGHVKCAPPADIAIDLSENVKLEIDI